MSINLNYLLSENYLSTFRHNGLMIDHLSVRLCVRPFVRSLSGQKVGKELTKLVVAIFFAVLVFNLALKLYTHRARA